MENNILNLVEHAPLDPLPLKDRIRLAKKRGDDFILALIDDGYGTAVIRNMGLVEIAKDIRDLYNKAKEGNEESRKALRHMLMIWGPPEIVGDAAPLAALAGIL